MKKMIVVAALMLAVLCGCQGLTDFQRGLVNDPPRTEREEHSPAYQSGQATGEALETALPAAVPWGGLGAVLGGGLALIRNRYRTKKVKAETREDAENVTTEIVRQIQTILDGPIGSVQFTGPDGKKQTVADAAKQVLRVQGDRAKALVDQVQREMGVKNR